MIDKKALWEAVKEPLRLLVLAIIPVAVVALTGISEQWAVAAVVVLRFIDKYLHELEVAKPVAKQTEGFLKLQGLTGF